ncbi:MAG: hypothetical protein NTZ26_07875 [Candidatus Aminicenantes bacterium]|nr:hypothetical protein [Candidatus Aminicenantes bacterium]
MTKKALIIVAAAVLLAACAKPAAEKPKADQTPSAVPAGGIMFKDDVDFLKAHTKVEVLTDPTGMAQVAVNPDLQGRVMTSTAGGPQGPSFGWINRAPLLSGENNLHMNAFGGEDRFWLGPEGGQFSIFFKKGEAFDLDHWFTPPPINEGALPVAEKSADRIVFKAPMRLTNYSGTQFDLEVVRAVSLLNKERLAALGVDAPAGLSWVAYETSNEITNTGTAPWTKDTGLLSIWILGMFNPSPATTIVAPFRAGAESELGPIVNDAYFGKVPADRLKVDVDKSVIYFKGDGLYRSKIGLTPKRAAAFIGSYDAAGKVLTLVKVTVDPAGDYVNSMWEIQKEPFRGDAVNSYNDGPASPGAKPLGPFYELETSSPAAALAPGAKRVHRHVTMHFQGDEAALDVIARKALGVGLADIKAAFVN